MSSTNTNYLIKNTNGLTDLINIFQINPLTCIPTQLTIYIYMK
jgi:hypothetical protein